MSGVGSSVQNILQKKPQAAKNKGFRTSVDSKPAILKAAKVELLLNYKKKLRLKSLNTYFFFERTI